MSLLNVPSIPFRHFVIIYCLTDATYWLTDAADWNQNPTPPYLADPTPNTQGRRQQKRLTEAEVTRWNGGLFAEASNSGKKSGEKIAGQESSPCSEKYNLQRRQSMHEDSTEEEEMRRQQRMKVMKDMTKKIRSKRKNEC